ncbi:MAG: PAS domain S-box protein, partial [Leptospira sp.]|nr:PAS domain S-box protein [Leptospira sp.]
MISISDPDFDPEKAELIAQLEQLKYQILIQNVLLDDFFNNSPCGYINLDKDGRIQKSNVTLLDWLGFSRKELLAFTDFKNLLIPINAEQFERGLEIIRNGGNVNNEEFTILKKDGSELHVYISGKIVSAPGEEILIRLTIFDVTDKKRIEKDLAIKSKEIFHQNQMMKRELTLAAGIQNA